MTDSLDLKTIVRLVAEQVREDALRPYFVSPATAARLLSIHRATFYEKFVTPGEISVVKIGTRTLVALDELDDLAERLKLRGSSS